MITNEIPENGILLVFCSDYRGGKGNAVAKNFDTVREEFYKLSNFDFQNHKIWGATSMILSELNELLKNV